jgi:hypothetical protein
MWRGKGHTVTAGRGRYKLADALVCSSW